MSDNLTHQSSLKALIAKGKEQNYLTYAEVNDHLPETISDPDQVEDIIQMIDDMGIKVYETAPDADQLALIENNDATDELAAAEAAAEDAVEREKPAKKQHLVLISEPEEGLPKDLVGWVVQILEDDDPREVAEKIADTASAFNNTPKGERVPVTSFGDACQSLPPKLLKEKNVWVKTREPVRIFAVKNSLGRRRARGE